MMFSVCSLSSLEHVSGIFSCYDTLTHQEVYRSAVIKQRMTQLLQISPMKC